jgi:hypothetical protein
MTPLAPSRETAPVEYGPLNPRPHPFLPSPTREEIDAAMASDEGAARYLDWYQRREKLVARSEQPGQLIKYAFELDCWRDADRDLADAKTDGRDYGGLYVGGGKRSSKSSWAARTVIRSALTYGQGIIWCLQRELGISKITQQRMIWEWLPQSIREKNDVSGKRKGGDHTKIRYTIDGGFTEGTAVLPNGTLLQFLSYKMDPKDYQGAEIGARIHPSRTARVGEWPWIARVDANGVAYDKDGLPIPNIGAWPDEDAPLAWVGTVRDRLTTRNAKFIWTFTTENGITRAVKSTLGDATNTETRPADDMLPQDRVVVRGCPPGHVPYRQRTATPGVNAIFFHTRFNVFGDNYPNMKARYEGKEESQVLANLYGYSEDIATRAYPLYGAWNVIDEEDLPAEGTNYLLGDPAGNRNWAWIWVRIAPGMGGEDWYIYDEWPDYDRYGAWAEPDESQDPNPDGVPGPAQRTLGWGIERYKQMILEKERLIVPAGFLTAEAQRRREEQNGQIFSHSKRHGANGAGGDSDRGARAVEMVRDGAGVLPVDSTQITSAPLRLCGELERLFPDPMKRRLVREYLANTEEAERQLSPTLSLPVRERRLDPRAAATPSNEQKGARTLLDKFAEETRDAQGNITGPRMTFKPAPGLDVQTGIAAVQQLLYFNDKEEIIRGLNAPRLFVVRRCRQVRWMFENYTGQGGEMGACKDFADLVRYAATCRLRYIAPGMTKTTGGGRSY